MCYNVYMDMWTRLKNTTKPVVIYGMGNASERLIAKLRSIGVEVKGVFASDGFVRHNDFLGYTVCSFDEMLALYPDMIVLVAFGSALPSVMDNIKRISSICETYAPCLSVVGDSYFDIEYVRSVEDKLRYIYSLLADDISRRTYENIVLYKLTGEIPYLSLAETPREEIWSIISPSANDTYLDLGAYNGDTALEYISHNPDYARIIAVEPDKRNFKKLSKILADYRQISLYNMAGSNTEEILYFDNRGSRSSLLGSVGTPTPTISIDTLIGEGHVEYINIDTEGNELKVIEGGTRTISSLFPTMLIATYHKATDIVDIPLKVLSINPNYKLYMRHHPYIPDWDTNYIFKT